MEENQSDRYMACLELYKASGGKNLTQIERDMRALGYTDFHRRILYGRKENGIYKPGWIEKFRWPEQLSHGTAGPPGNAGAPACMSAKHEQPPRDRNDRDVTPPHPGSVAGEGACVPGNDFPSWLKQVSPELTWDWRYQKYIYKQLEKVTSGACKRMMIFMPPRHGKSELVTVRYAGWRLWNDPAMRIIVSSYNQRLADRFSRSIRRVLSREEEKQLRSEDCGVLNEEGFSPSLVPQRTARKRQSADYPQCGPAASQPDNSAVRTPQSALPRMFPPSRTINTASQWETALGGGVKAVGVGAGVTGFGAQLIVIDDPIKNRAEAESETWREKTWDWYRNDIYTRLEPDGAILLIQTRWHEDDLAGRLLQEMHAGGDQWEIINLPALAEPGQLRTAECEVRNHGEMRNADCGVRNSKKRVSNGDDTLGQNKDNSAAKTPQSAVRTPQSDDPLGRRFGAALCPQRFDEKALDEKKRQLGSYAFSALYQQRPTPAEGRIFKLAWFDRFVDRAPKGLIWKRGYDLAVSTKTSACYTSSFRVAFDEAGNLYIADGFRKRIEYPDQRRYIISRLLAEPDTEHGIEKALHGEAIIQDIRREKKVRGSMLKGFKVTDDKLTRALNWSPLAEEGKVILVRGPWNREFIEEVCQFPGGQFDDQVDAVSLAVTMFQDRGKGLRTFS